MLVDPVFLLDPTIPGGHWKAGEIIRGLGDCGVQGQSPWWVVKGAKPPETQASVDRDCPTCLQRHLSNIL